MTAVGMPIFLGFYILNQNSDISSQYMVYTGVRTRDNGQPFLLPVPSPDNDEYSRVYGCMMDANIGRGPSQCGEQDSISDFQTCIRARPAGFQCDQYITTNSDIALLKCLQQNYNVTIRQTNVFLECMSLSQPATFQSTQNADSTVFLGSYNYAVLLVDALTVIASFVVFTSGGWFFPGSVSLDPSKGNHIRGSFNPVSTHFFSPFSIFRIYVAWFWNLLAFLIAVGIAYSNNDLNAANREDSSKRFPLTLWTCVLSIGLLAAAVAFYTYYAFEWVFTGQYTLFYSNDAASASNTGGNDPGAPPGNEIAALYSSRRRQYVPQTFASALTRRFVPLIGSRRGVSGRYMGVQLYDADSITETGIKAKNIMPLMFQAFAWAWVLTDGIFFVGMLTSQSSITNESVNRVFFSITAGRLFQLAGAYMAYKAYINVITADNQDLSVTRGVLIASVLVHAASLFCIGIATAEFMSTVKFSYAASLPTASFPSYHSIQWCFIIFIVILPETWRILNFLLSTIPMEEENSKISHETLLVLSECLFTWEWIARLIIAVITIIPLSVAVKDQQNIFLKFLMSTA